MRRKIISLFAILIALNLLISVDTAYNMANPPHLTIESSISDLLSHPVLKPFALHVLPRPEDARRYLKLKDAAQLMPWHGHIRPQEIVDALNRLIDDAGNGRQVFYQFQDQTAPYENTGLFFFRGKPDSPFAIICPGGGFRYIGSLHEGFPLAKCLSEHGYNAFALQYRPGSEKLACEDLAQALSWIFRNAAKLKISTRDYSVWGGSAGARMAADLGSYGSLVLGGDDLPKPAAVIMAYTGHNWISEKEPPTFAVVSEDDPIAPASVMKERIKALQNRGTPAQIMVVKRAGHGFGMGTGTEAEGWVDKALEFWKMQTGK